jgi:endo-beta-N-acetylglucosaminidase D
MLDFLVYFKQVLAARVPGSEVHWYDSVIESGQLAWQNQLNEANR